MTVSFAANAGEVVGAVSSCSRSADELVSLIDDELHPTDEQRVVIEAPFEPTLVIAGAGSGKTHTLALRFLYLLDHGTALAGRDLSPDEILCLTFTRKAAGEIAERVNRYLDRAFGTDPHRPAPAISTYNAYAAGLVAEHGLRIGVDPDSVVLSEAALWQMAARLAEDWVGDLDFDGTLSTVATAVPALAAALADHGKSPADLSGFLERMAGAIEALPLGKNQRSDKARLDAAAKFRTRASLAAVVEAFTRAKRASSFLDFSDQIALARELAAKGSVRMLEHARFKAVLLDEFQDTSPGQIDLLGTMFSPEVPVMAVGDPNQAIYGFRGASEGALAGFSEAFGGDAAISLTLSVSWRNSREVLRAANAVTAPLRGVTNVPVPTLTSKSEALDLPERPHDGPAITANVFIDAASEAAAIVDAIAARRAALERTMQPGKAPLKAAILCRVRRLFPPIVTALREAGVDYQVVGLGGLVDTPVVVDTVALLEVAHDPSRGDSLMRLLSGERLALGIRDIAALKDWAEELAGPRESREMEISIVDALDDLPRRGWVSRDGRALSDAARGRLADLSATIATIRAHTYLPVPDLVSFTARAAHLDIEARLAARATGGGRGDEALDALVEAARTFVSGVDHSGVKHGTLGGFLAWLDAAREREDGLDSPIEQPRSGAVQVMTVHAAKGMEWDVVAIAGLNDGVFPTVGVSGGIDQPVYRSGGWLTHARDLPWPLRRDAERLPEWGWEEAKDVKEFQVSEKAFRAAAGAHAIDEERRLFYVALTRARTDVILTSSWLGSGSTVRPVSLYVRELVESGIVSSDGWAPRPEGAAASLGEGSENSEDDVAESDPRPAAPPVPWPSPPGKESQRRRVLAAEILAAIAAQESTHETGLPYEREISAMLAETRAGESEGVTVILPSHLTSTALVALSRDRDAFAIDLRRPIPHEPASAARKGSAFHAWVEAYFNRPTLDDPDEWGENDEGDTAGLRQSFLSSEWAARRPMAVEANVEIPAGGIILRCRIDAVFPSGDDLDKVTVVDWKTGEPPTDALERAAREVQLSVYRLAWAAWKGIPVDAVDAVFVYVGAGETVRPERFLGEEEVVRLFFGE